MPKLNKQELLDEFKAPKEEIELLDAIRCFIYVHDIAGLLSYMRLLIKESTIIFKKD